MTTTAFTEEQEFELAESAKKIDAEIDDIDVVEREAEHIATIMQADHELIKRQIFARRFMEKKAREEKKRTRTTLIFVILVYICKLDPLRAMALASLMSPEEPVSGLGVGVG